MNQAASLFLFRAFGTSAPRPRTNLTIGTVVSMTIAFHRLLGEWESGLRLRLFFFFH